MEKFKFTNWRNAVWVEGADAGTTIYGIRKKNEELFITIRVSGVGLLGALAMVVYRYHKGDALHEQVVKCYGDLMEMEKGIREYIDDLEK